jgi:hypothetical protein
MDHANKLVGKTEVGEEADGKGHGLGVLHAEE